MGHYDRKTFASQSMPDFHGDTQPITQSKSTAECLLRHNPSFYIMIREAIKKHKRDPQWDEIAVADVVDVCCEFHEAQCVKCKKAR